MTALLNNETSMKIESILIIEDTPETLVWLKDVAAEVFPVAEIITVINLAEAKTAVHERSFDLALVDLGLPDGTGGELIDLIRTKQQPTYIVVATIYDEQNQAPFSQRSMAQVLGHFHRQGEERRDSKLTKRQEDVLVLIAKGYSAADTAMMLNISENTAKGYIKDIYAALAISSRAEAAAYAIKRNLIEPD